jgi:hypothetical protein
MTPITSTADMMEDGTDVAQELPLRKDLMKMDEEMR